MFQARLRRALALGAATAIAAAITAAPASARRGDVVCHGTLEHIGEVTGNVAHNVIVPENQACVITLASVGHNVILEPGSYVGITSTTIKHSVIGHKVATLETANFEPNAGPVSIGHNLELTGVQENAENANGYVICDTTVNHNVVINDTSTPYGTELGDTATGPENFCSGGPDPNATDKIGGSLLVTDNVFGRLDIAENSITRNMTIENNRGTTAFGDEGTLRVAGNTIGRNATCAANTPELEKNPPNKVARHDDGC